jgi:GxxExxY protein
MENDLLTGQIIGKALEVHSMIGPGLLESVYRDCLAYELKASGLYVQTEVPVKFTYKDMSFERGFRIDILVESKVVIELKTVEKLSDVHVSQILTYMKVGRFKVGLLINFNVSSLKQGIKRLVI